MKFPPNCRINKIKWILVKNKYYDYLVKETNKKNSLIRQIRDNYDKLLPNKI